MKKRNKHATTERAGVIAVTAACNNFDLIWRDLLQEDVGVDGTIEIVIDGFPTGKIVGGQIKSGTSYIRSETANSFRFYPDKDDVDYWLSLTIPIFLFVHDPRDGAVYWVDVQKQLGSHAQASAEKGPGSIMFEKANKLDEDFKEYLKRHFDLVIYETADYEKILSEMRAIQFQGGFDDAVSITALDLFVRGLWGLCSKVQFHLSLLTDEIRDQLADRTVSSSVRYDLSRSHLFPFLTSYFKVLTKHHLSTLDMSDINHTLYGKLEWPAFISPLTLNGRKYVEFLRHKLLGEKAVRDHQFFSLSLYPHVQIEIFESFDPDSEPVFGPFMDVLIIRFNPYLDYYSLVHFARDKKTQKLVLKANINTYYYELISYLEFVFKDTPENNVMCRYQDGPISPLICWLENRLDYLHPTPVEHFREKTFSHQAAFREESLAIFAPLGALTVHEDYIPDFRSLELANGEFLFQDAKD